VVLGANRKEDLQVLETYANFWRVPFSPQPISGEHQAILYSGAIPDGESGGANPIIFSPTGLECAKEIARKFDLGMSMVKGRVHLPYSPSAETSSELTLFHFNGPHLETILESDGNAILSRITDTNIYVLSVDLVSEFSLRIAHGLEDSPSVKFRLATRLPFSYQAIPRFLRERAFRMEGSESSGDKLGPVECLRTIFLASLVTVSPGPLPTLGFWAKGKKFAFAVTHDIETEEGLQKGSQALLGVERELGIRSTWNVVTQRYPLDRDKLAALSESGEIGGHDTAHDGRLIFLPPEARTARLRQCRETLEKVSGARVRGFRAPLLQHDRELVEAVGEAGYEFDSSVPSWELRSPTSLKPHGVGTVFPFDVTGVLELPVSLPQDHQMLRVRRLTLGEAELELTRVSKWIGELGGLCTLLVHPDYEFAIEDEGAEYSRLLRTFREDPKCEIVTMGEATNWWTKRNTVELSVSEGEVRTAPSETDEKFPYQILAVTSYGPKGFSWETLN
jgi:peptidoglycan/xylan/chitin deacetylase (PgdA/CDA1 family)